MDAMTLLNHRISEPKLSLPGPDREALLQILSAAARAPDHGRLQPWRFLLIEGKARYRLGELFISTLRARRPDVSPEEIKRSEEAPLRAPLIITVIARVREHPKVPKLEQVLSAGCAAHGILLAAQALGFGAIWRTGDSCYDPAVKAALGLIEGEEIVGYIYVGSALGIPKPLPEIHIEDLIQTWDGAEPLA